MQRCFDPLRKARRPAFTLIEILVVVAIIALLISILLPSLARARAQAKTVVCTTQIQQLMRASLMYKMDFKDRLPAASRLDEDLAAQYESGARNDWLSWSGIWKTGIKMDSVSGEKCWQMAPKSGRLWKYYRDESLLRCPAALRFNGRLSYSMPENVALAMKDSSNVRKGLPPLMDKVKHPASAILFVEESEAEGISNYSTDDGFGEPDMFADRHVGRATVALFDGHAVAQYFPRGPGTRINPTKPQVPYSQNRSAAPFEAWMIQIAPFNCKYTPEPWKWRGIASMPKFKKDCNWPYGAERSNGPGWE